MFSNTNDLFGGLSGDNTFRIPKEYWDFFAAFIAQKNLSKEEALKAEEKLLEFNIPDKWQKLFLPLADVYERALTKEFSARTVDRLVEEMNRTERVLTESEREEFYSWVRGSPRKETWDFRKIIKYRRKAEAAKENWRNSWLFGDCLVYVEDLQDESVSLTLTDPPYGIAYRSNRRKASLKHEFIKSDIKEDAALELLEDILLDLYPKHKPDSHLLCFCHWSNEEKVRRVIESTDFKIKGSLIWYKNNKGMGDLTHSFAPIHERIIHAVKGNPILFRRECDVLTANRVPAHNHPTEKPVDLLIKLINVTTTKNELIADPFGGVASTAAAAKAMGRKFWGVELDEVYYRVGSERLMEDE